MSVRRTLEKGTRVRRIGAGHALAVLLLGAVTAAVAVAHPRALVARPTAERATPNDNRAGAGTLRDGVLTLTMEARRAIWGAGGPNDRAVEVFAFAEDGRAPSIPGPLLRVPAGTEVRVTVRNALDRPMWMHGLHDHDGSADSTQIAAGASHTFAFRAFTPGTQFYWARTTAGGRVIGRYEESQLVGGFIVDPPGVRTDDRVLVLTSYDDTTKATGYPSDHFQIFAINGRSWPHTTREVLTEGDSTIWRIINAGDHSHPMHLHGFFFNVESVGTPWRDTVYTGAQRRLGVTELLSPASTARIAWRAERAGNWLFHCHMITHIETLLRLDRAMGADGHDMAHASHDNVEGVMSGLVVAVSVTPKSRTPAKSPSGTDANARRLRLYVTERPSAAATDAQLAYVLQRGSTPPAADSIEHPSSTLTLRQGEPTEIVVTNLTGRATAVHWHGLELESYFDGVAGWSGADARTAPIIAPRDSFVVRLTPPRAGTYMYHTHADETPQLRGGLYGPLIVLPPHVVARDTTERTLILTNRGPEPHGGATTPDLTPIELSAGVPHRLRILSIGVSSAYRVRLLRADSTETTWRPLARDGADLTMGQAVEQPAVAVLGAGQTLDLELRRRAGEALTLELRRDNVESYRIPVRVR